VNKPTKVAGTQSVEDVLSEIDAQRAANLRIWTVLSKTDPMHTKQFSRAGGFRGTAIKPIWITQRLTELFGPCGHGWGFAKPEFQLVPAGNEILVYCTVTAWYIDPADAETFGLNEQGPPQSTVYGVGGDKVMVQRQSGPFCDDEAFKKAFTDALGNAFKFVGVAADVHMGLFEDSKYLAEVTAEFHPKPDNPKTGEPKPKERVKYEGGPYTCPTQLMTAARAFVHTLNGLSDYAEYLAWAKTPDVRDFIKQLKKEMPDWWSGGPSCPEEFVPLEILAGQKERDLQALDEIKTREAAE
jgi:hypothetical protein